MIKIDVLVDVYPHPHKPYFDVQFEEWAKSNHRVRVFSLASIPEATAPLPVRRIQTLREQPLVLSALMLLAFVLRPRRSARVLFSCRGLIAGIKRLAVDAQMPRSLPDLFLIHNLAAAHRWRYLCVAAPSVRRALYYHGGEIAGVQAISRKDSKAAFRSMHLVFSNTNYSVGDAIARGAEPHKMRKIPVGFKLSEFPDITLRNYKKSGKYQFGSVGRLAKEKGFDVALKAIAKISKTRDDIQYTVIGDGPERRALEDLSEELGIKSLTVFKGNLHRHEIAATLAELDVLVLSSIPANTWQETQACVMQEAMLARMSVVASNTGGVSESIPPEMRRYLFDPGDHDDLADQLRELLMAGEPKMRELGAIGRKFAEDNYDISKTNEKLLFEAMN